MFVGQLKSLHADICIVGLGPAGITLARELLNAGMRVVAIDLGAMATASHLDAFDGVAEGPIIKDYPTYLPDSRSGGIGGAGSGWGTGGRVWCIPYSRLDLEPRAWVPESGWPLSAGELIPYLRRAAELMGLAPLGARPMDPTGIPGTCLTGWAYRYPRDSMVFRHMFADIARDPLFRAELETTALALDSSGVRARRLQAVRPDGNLLVVEADAFVLAGGGVENARFLLLQARGADPFGVVSDRIGRYFMEHFHVYAGTVVDGGSALHDYLHDTGSALPGAGMRRVLGLSATRQRDDGLLNATIQLSPEPGAGGSVANCSLFVRSEQAPNPDSRVMLDERKDRLRRSRARLSWQTLEQDWRSVVRFGSAVGDELERAFDLRVRLEISERDPWPWPPADPAVSSRPTWAHHHIGTTRMSADSTTGVVDPDCRVWGTENVFVAGSSVFPTSGFANPTFTIVALALRLADRLRGGSLPDGDME